MSWSKKLWPQLSVFSTKISGFNDNLKQLKKKKNIVTAARIVAFLCSWNTQSQSIPGVGVRIMVLRLPQISMKVNFSREKESHLTRDLFWFYLLCVWVSWMWSYHYSVAWSLRKVEGMGSLLPHVGPSMDGRPSACPQTYRATSPVSHLCAESPW